MGITDSIPRKKFFINHEKLLNSELNSQQNQIDCFIPLNYSQFDQDYWLKNLQEVKKDPNSKLLFLPLSYSKITSSFDCNTSSQLKLSFENFPYLLEAQIKNRSANQPNNYFDEEELWILLYSLVKSQKAFSNLSLKVGDIHPHSIFLNEEGYLRLACQFSWPNQKTNFQKIYYDKNLCFLSPEQLQLLEQGHSLDNCYSNTSQAFSIGMTLLSSGLLQTLDRYCDTNKFKFNHKYLDYCINRWMTLKFKQQESNEVISYSDELKDIVKNLCHLNKHQRYLPSKVYDFLQPYESQIMNLQKFHIQNYTKIQKQLSPQIHYPKNTHHQNFFNHYAALSGNKANTEIQNQVSLSTNIKKARQFQNQYSSPSYQNTNSAITATFTALSTQKQADSVLKTQKSSQNPVKNIYSIQNISLSTHELVQKQASKDLSSQINLHNHSRDMLARIQKLIEQSKETFLKDNK